MPSSNGSLVITIKLKANFLHGCHTVILESSKKNLNKRCKFSQHLLPYITSGSYSKWQKGQLDPQVCVSAMLLFMIIGKNAFTHALAI
jgi:hypothetical protein